MDYIQIINEAMPYLKEGIDMLKDTALDEVKKAGTKTFINWIKGKFTRQSVQNKIDETLINPSEENLKKFEVILQEAITDKEILLNELREKLDEFKENISQISPQIKTRIKDSKNIIAGSKINIGSGNFNVGDSYK